MKQNDDRMVTTTVAKLRAFEAATRAEAQANVNLTLALAKLEVAKEVHQARAREFEAAQDARAAAARALHEEDAR